MGSDPKGLYAALGVATDATEAKIRAAFRRRAKKCHPDGSNPDVELFRELKHAYDVLSDPARRARYDADGDDAVDGAEKAQEDRALVSIIQQIVGNLVEGPNNPMWGVDQDLDNDVNTVILNGLRKKAVEIGNGRQALFARRRRIEKLQKRLRRKPGVEGEDIVAAGFRHHEEMIKAQLQNIDDALALNARVIKFWEDYEYTTMWGDGGTAQGPGAIPSSSTRFLFASSDR